jgi:hypothetical protein
MPRQVVTMRNTFFLAVAGIAAVVGLAAAGNQGPGVNRVMREKLDRSQKILEAVVTSDWVSLETESRELQRLTEDPRWTVLNFPEYARHSADFKRTIADLHEAAAQRDLEKTPKAYVAMTLSCVSCHRYLARARVAQQGNR